MAKSKPKTEKVEKKVLHIGDIVTHPRHEGQMKVTDLSKNLQDSKPLARIENIERSSIYDVVEVDELKFQYRPGQE